MTLVLSLLLLTSVFVNAWCFRALADTKTREARLQAKLEDGEVMPGKVTDPPAAIRRIRQDR